ncbi:Sapep family Mn(2+)-dependent dipeptidase [Cloacibacillus sp.]
MNERLDRIVKSYLPRLVQSVCESVRIPSLCAEDASGFPYGMEIARAADHAMACARQLDFKVTDLDGKICWADYGDGEETVAVMGHLDVVAPGEGWDFEPFCGCVKNGAILGRGTQDDKGPLFSSLYALKAVADLGIPLSKRVRIIFGMDEESGKMRDVEAYLKSERPPLYAFTPDGAYPVVNTEKGTIKFTSTAVFETTSEEGLSLEKIAGGESVGSVPARAEAVLRGEIQALERTASAVAAAAKRNGWKTKIAAASDHLTITVYGKAAHATLPELGENAVGRLLILLQAAEISGGAGKFVRFLADKIGVEADGRSLGIRASHAHCGVLTVNMAKISGDEHSITVTCGIYIPAETISFDSVCAALEQAFSAAGGSFDPFAKAAPLFYSPEHPLIKTLQRGYHNATGKEPYLVSMCGGTYSKRMPNMVPYGATFENEDDRAHGANERLLITNLMESTRLMAYAILEMAR